KYFWAMMSVATCDQPLGMRMLFISNTTDPSGLRMVEERWSHGIASKASRPSGTHFVETESPLLFALIDRPSGELLLEDLFFDLRIPGLVFAPLDTSISWGCQAIDGEVTNALHELILMEVESVG